MKRFAETSVAVLSVASLAAIAVTPDKVIHAPYNDTMSILSTTVGSTNAYLEDYNYVQDTITGEEIPLFPLANLGDVCAFTQKST
jgi:hypothetical protein